MPQRFQRTVALLLAGLLAVEGILAALAHRHGHDHSSHETVSSAHAPAHACGGLHDHDEPDSSQRQPEPAPPQDDDCAACRYLAQQWVSVAIETDVDLDESVGELALPICHSPSVETVRLIQARAPPPLV